MNLFESITVAFEGLSANKVRSFLTMLGVIIGVGAVIAMLAIARGARERTMSFIQNMGTNVLTVMGGQARTGNVRVGMGSMQTLTFEDSESLPSLCPSVLKASPEARTSAQVKYRNQNTNTTILGVVPGYLEIRNFQIANGNFFTDSDVRSIRKVAVIGQTTATNLFGDVSPVGKDISIKGMKFNVVGLLATKGATGFMDQDDQILIPATTALRRLIGSKYVRSISVQAASMELMNQAMTEITAVLRTRHRLAQGADDDFNIRNQADIMQMADSSNQVFTLLLAGIASVSLLVGGIGIMNIMLVSVTERTREIGVRMALGARRNDILAQFLIEALVLSLLGGLIGILIGYCAATIIGRQSGWNVSVSMLSVILSFTFSAFVGVFFGLYPAFRASRLDPIDALRYE